MKKHYLLGIAFLLLTIFSSFAQQVPRERVAPCYFDELLSKQIQEDPLLQKKLDEMDHEIERFKANRKKGGSGVEKSLGDKLLIPVVVNVVHQNGPENITDMQVISQINALNTYYEDYGVQFCLATKKGTVNLTTISTPSGITSSTPGIFHYYNPTLTNHDVSQINSLAAVGASLPADNYLRIWVVKSITSASVPPGSIIQGYSSFPGNYGYTDGIVMDYRAFGDIATCGCSTLASYSQLGRIAVHEVGHYLGLYHTFQDGCAGMNSSTCASQGDRVCDTPPVAAPGNTGCPSAGWNTCSEIPNLPDDIHNYMDYVDEGCMTGFTPGQKDRMDASISLYRANLVSSGNMVYTGINCNGQVMAHFTADNYAPCTGTSVIFTANPVSGATYSWDFGDGSTGSGQVVTHTYSAAYSPAIVTLTVTDGVNLSDFAENEALVFPTNCTTLNNTESTWMFSNQAGLDFSSGVPVYDNSADVNNTMQGNIEDVVSQCDASGNLLFYSSGDVIWDQNHSVIASGLSADNSSATGSMAIPNPANASQYLQFNTSYYYGLRYSVISMTGTQAAIVSNNNPVPVPAGYVQENGTLWSGEGVTAIKACNYYWLIVHGKKSEYQHYLMVYKVSASGIAFHSDYLLNGFESTYTTMEASPDGTKILVAEFTGNSMYLCDFNPASGFVTGDEIINRERVYGTSFSPDSKLFYAVQETTGDLFQYDATASNVSLSEVKIGSLIAPYTVKRLGMQCGPDNKIYISRNMTQMGAIHAPNTQSTISQSNLCLFTNNGPYLDVLASGCGLPNNIDANNVQVFTGDQVYATEVNCNTYIFSSNICATSYSWNFGDPASGSANNASGASPTHVFSGPGTYNVVVTGNGVTLSYTVVVSQNCQPCACPADASFDYTVDEKDCYVKFHASYTADPCLENVEYTWDFGDGTTGSGMDIDHAFASAGTHEVCLTVTAVNGSEPCTVRFCKKIETRCTPPCDCKQLRPSFKITFDDKECVYTFEGAQGGSECFKFVEYYWEFSDGTTSIGQITGHVFPAAGSYDVCLTVVVRNEKGDILCSERYCEKVEARCGGRCDCKLKPEFDMVNFGDCNMLFTGFSGSDCANITQMEWTINGAGPYYGQYLSTQFQVNTSYQICLTVTGNNGKDECKETYCQEYFYTDCYPFHGKSATNAPVSAAPQCQLYPNPASESVSLRLLFQSESATYVTLKTADGKIIGTYAYDMKEREMNIEIPSAVSNGFVFVEVRSGDYFFTEKLMIMH
jgi:hypothetical protein